MSKSVFEEILKPVDETSQQKLDQFLDRLHDLSFFYSSNQGFPSLVEKLFYDENADFCILEFGDTFDALVHLLWETNWKTIKRRLEKDEILNPSGEKIFYPKMLENAAFLSRYFNALLDAILKKKTETKFHIYAYGSDKLDITISPAVLLNIKKDADFYYQEYEELTLEGNLLYQDVFLHPFALLFDVTIQGETIKNEIKKPFLMVFDKCLFGDSDRVVYTKQCYLC